MRIGSSEEHPSRARVVDRRRVLRLVVGVRSPDRIFPRRAFLWVLVVLTEVASSFLRFVTDSRITAEPDTPQAAMAFVDSLTIDGRFMREPRVSRWQEFEHLSSSVDVRRSLVPDALLAATCLDWDAAFLTADRDFLRFPGIRVHLLTSIGIIDHTVV